MQLISNASGWTRLWWIEVWLQPESTKAQYVPPLILTGIWYPPAWSGAACGTSGTRTRVPTSITGHRSIKWPGSPQRQQAGPGFPATPVAGRGTRNWRGETEETGPAAGLGPADPASRPWALAAVDSGAGPPLLRGWARGTTPARDLGRKIGGDTEGEGRERETDCRILPTPWHATIWSSASWMARSSDAGRWHWTHCAVALLGLSTPITAIRHRCSSFCTWPTYLPLSPESFSRCRLRWTTPPSPHSPTAIFPQESSVK